MGRKRIVRNSGSSGEPLKGGDPEWGNAPAFASASEALEVAGAAQNQVEPFRRPGRTSYEGFFLVREPRAERRGRPDSSEPVRSHSAG